MSDTLERGLAELGLSEQPGLRAALGRYAAAIEAWNPAYGLVGASGDELVVKHVLDSLAPLGRIRSLLAQAEAAGAPASLVDLGTGAGLPGIPLSLALPGTPVTLLDRMTRRIRFLEAMLSELPLPDASIVEEQVERAKGSYGIVTFRAFRPFERKLFKKVFSVCAPGGFVVAYKGRIERARAELAEIEGLYAEAVVEPLAVPFLPDERCLVVMRPVARRS